MTREPVYVYPHKKEANLARWANGGNVKMGIATDGRTRVKFPARPAVALGRSFSRTIRRGESLNLMNEMNPTGEWAMVGESTVHYTTTMI